MRDVVHCLGANCLIFQKQFNMQSVRYRFSRSSVAVICRLWDSRRCRGHEVQHLSCLLGIVTDNHEATAGRRKRKHWKTHSGQDIRNFNFLITEINMKLYICNFQMDFSDWWLRHLLWNYLNMNVIGLHWWSVNIGSLGVTRPEWVKVLTAWPSLHQIHAVGKVLVNSTFSYVCQLAVNQHAHVFVLT